MKTRRGRARDVPVEDIQTLNKQEGKSRRDHVEEETTGEAISPGQTGTSR